MKYEYRTIKADAPLSAIQLNEQFGVDGWELVEMFRDEQGIVERNKWIIYFKKVVDDG